MLIRALTDPKHLEQFCRGSHLKPDWPHVLALAEAQGVFPSLARRMDALSHSLDPETRAAIVSKYEAHVRRSLVMTSQLVRLLQLLASVQVQAIPFKGPALAISLYGDAAARSYSDLDILVRRQQAGRAVAAMREAGYAQLYPVTDEHAEPFFDSNYELNFSSSAGILVELHWDIAPRHFSMALPAEDLWIDLGSITLAGVQTPALSPENLLLALSVHGAHHLWRRLAWITDIHRLIAITPKLDFDRVLARARAAGIERIVLLALAVSKSVVGTSLPAKVEEAIEDDPTIAALTDEVWQKSLFRESASDVQFHSFLLRSRERWQDRARYASRFVLTPTMQEWTTVRLPRRLHFLYSGLRIARGLAKAGRIIYHSVRASPS